MKKSYVIILIALFGAFLGYEFSQDVSFEVLKILSPTEVVVDINNNGVEDDDEIFCLNDVQSFSTKLTGEQRELAKKIKISEEDAIGLGFLAQEFAKEHLAQKAVKLKLKKSPCTSCTPAEIYVDHQNYQSILLNSGLALSSGLSSGLSSTVKDKAPTSTLFNRNLQKARKLNLKTFNNKSHKYHKLNCKYGSLAHNSQIIPSCQLPKDAKPCKFCSVKHEKYEKHQKYGTHQQDNFFIISNFIPNVAQVPTSFCTNSIKVFLTDLTTVQKPSNLCNTALCRELVQQVNSAQSSIDFAIYGYTKIPQIQSALENAQKRGVKIRFVYDIDGKNQNIYPDTIYLTKIFTANHSDFNTKGSAKKYQSSIMHNKFFIFDNKTVMTGSANLSNTDYSGFNSNAVIWINSPAVANIYSQEFEQMFGEKFHNLKSKLADKDNIQVEVSDFSVYFSPKDKAITTQIVPLVDCAQKYIYMPVFLITHKTLAESLIRASKRGVEVKVIVDATNARGSSSKHQLLRDNGVLVKTENYAGKLHSKSIIIDDLYTVIGSMNFSKSGETANDENLIIVENREISMFYKTFFRYLWAKIPDKWLKFNARAESPDSIGSCSDGLDNDFDGKIDRLDNSCVHLKNKK